MSESVTGLGNRANNLIFEDDDYERDSDFDSGAVQLNTGDNASILVPYDDEPITRKAETGQELEDEVDIDGIRITILQGK